MEDVPILRRKLRPPLAKPEDLEDEISPRNKTSNTAAVNSLTLSPDEEIQEEQVRGVYCAICVAVHFYMGKYLNSILLCQLYDFIDSEVVSIPVSLDS